MAPRHGNMAERSYALLHGFEIQACFVCLLLTFKMKFISTQVTGTGRHSARVLVAYRRAELGNHCL
jgi:hypothetical protein